MPLQTALIIGSGIAGPLTALSLHTHNISPKIFESRATPSTIGGAINLTPNAVRILSSHNLLQPLLPHACPVKSLEIFSANTGKRIGTVPFGDVEKYGFDSLRVLRSELQKVLLAALEEKGIQVRYAKKLIGVREEGEKVTAVFEDGTEESGDILIGADGIHSAVRRSYIDPDAKAVYSGVSSAYGVVDFSALGVGRREDLHFSATGLSTSRKGSFLLSFCDAARTRVFWAVVMGIEEGKVPDRTEGWKAKDQEGTKGEIVRRFEECQVLAGLVEKAVMGTKEVCFFPVSELKCGGRWWRGRCVLVGDAAHAMPPQGQSVGLAFEDVVLLMRVLTELPEEKTLEERFVRWEELRRPRVEASYREAARVFEGVREISWWWNVVREWLYWFFLGLFMRHTNQAFLYDVSKVPL